jgi:cytochrome c553
MDQDAQRTGTARPFVQWVSLVAMAWSLGVHAQPAQQELARGVALAQERCASCHGLDGQSAADSFPRLAGQNQRYLVKQLLDFGAGKRQSTVMKDKVAGLRDADIRALASHYEAQPGVRTPSGDALLDGVGRFIYERGNAYAGLPACLSCHGADGRGTADLPRLAGQHPAYIEKQMRQFADRARSNDSAIMTMMAARMSELELKAVAAYIGGMK